MSDDVLHGDSSSRFVVKPFPPAVADALYERRRVAEALQKEWAEAYNAKWGAAPKGRVIKPCQVRVSAPLVKDGR
jgi:hypothetical protein